jgi:transposase
MVGPVLIIGGRVRQYAITQGQRMLHKAAKFIVEKYAGKFPQAPEEILELPGVGRYTAGAIASIAFGRARSNRQHAVWHYSPGAA